VVEAAKVILLVLALFMDLVVALEQVAVFMEQEAVLVEQELVPLIIVREVAVVPQGTQVTEEMVLAITRLLQDQAAVAAAAH
jgi:hypothetical protein